MFFWLLLLTRIAGQRQIGRLSGFDLVVVIALIATATGPLHSARDSVTSAMISTAVIAVLDVGLSYVALRNSKLRRMVEDEPLVIMQNGRVLEGMMRKARFNIDNLLSELRIKGIHSLCDVEFAILEPNGRLSVIPKSQARPLTPRDAQVSTHYEGLSTVLIEDGNVLEDNLRRVELSKEWLYEQLQQQGLSGPHEAMLASLDTQGVLYVARKGDTYRH
ncbi:MAG: YetF domain-containing protein [Limnochordia bacterium]|jgi:uncharacterized membrane protein YcaP (DUF421 family)